MIILTLTAGVSTLHPPAHAGATRLQLAVLVLAFVFIVAGAGGIRPCNLAFGADQLDPRTDHGRRGINSFFTFTIAVCVSSTAIIYVQSNVSWWVGFAIPAALLLVSCALFFAGARLYVRVRPEGSPLASVIRVAAAAFRNRHVAAPDDPGKSLFRTHHASELVSMLPYTGQFRSLDKAAVVVLKSEVDLDGLPKDPMATVQHAAGGGDSVGYLHRALNSLCADEHLRRRSGGTVRLPLPRRRRRSPDATRASRCSSAWASAWCCPPWR
uniref:Uncharacterized protein n=1 Tax=Aegilops tauschii subsp. strangulata TaxID=200361 RepID=A0A452XQ83_AEGTS